MLILQAICLAGSLNYPRITAILYVISFLVALCLGHSTGVANSIIEVPVTQPHILNSIGLKSAPGALDIEMRRVGRTAAQNKVAQVEAKLTEKRGAQSVRLDQLDTDLILNPETGLGELMTTSRGRPDVNIIDKEGNSIKLEFDRSPASRALNHAQQHLDANPDADVWLLTLDNIGEDHELMKVITANRKAIDDYVGSLPGRV